MVVHPSLRRMIETVDPRSENPCPERSAQASVSSIMSRSRLMTATSGRNTMLVTKLPPFPANRRLSSRPRRRQLALEPSGQTVPAAVGLGSTAPDRAGACIPEGRTAPPAAARGCRATACRRRAAPDLRRRPCRGRRSGGWALPWASPTSISSSGPRGWAAGVSGAGLGLLALRDRLDRRAGRHCRSRPGTGCRSRAAASARP